MKEIAIGLIGVLLGAAIVLFGYPFKQQRYQYIGYDSTKTSDGINYKSGTIKIFDSQTGRFYIRTWYKSKQNLDGTWVDCKKIVFGVQDPVGMTTNSESIVTFTK